MKYSYFDQEIIIKKYLDLFGIEKGIAVDIAASNGVDSSNTVALYRKGWSGLAVEYRPSLFTHLAKNYHDHQAVSLCRCKITPLNVVGVIRAFCKDVDFLSLDIDGYDYFVLDAILEMFRPKLICAEINQNIPPPIKFTVKYDPVYWWGENGFFGQSLSQVEILCKRYGYHMLEIEYNDVFIAPNELTPDMGKSPEMLYMEGFYNREDKDKCKYDRAMVEQLLHSDDNERIMYIDLIFSEYKGKYICSI